VHAEDPQLEVELHRRAARWYESHDRPIEAIEHFLAAGDSHTVFELVVANVPRLHQEARRADLAAWLASVPEDYVAADPDRAVSFCTSLFITARPEWIPWWRRCDRMVGDDRPDLRRRLNIIRAVGLGSQGRSGQFYDVMRRIPPSGEEPLDEFLAIAHAELLSLDGAHAEAVDMASALFAAPRVFVRDPVALSVLARALHEAGKHERAQAAAERAVRLWRELGEPDLIGMVDALTLRADALRESDDLDAAEELATLAVALCDSPPPHIYTVRSALALSAVEEARGDHERARRRLIDVAEDARLGRVDARLVGLINDRLRTPVPSPGRGRRVELDHVLVEQLTERELKVLPLLRSHLTFPEIGEQLHISRHTVKTHVSRIYRKLGVSSRSAAVREAVRRGLLSPTPG
jgi:LuxR family maltose regulon positive regulatory protein